jgi:phosphoribosylformimino-5-aminoimidazole carboxamide ribotide isomerase
VLSLKEKFIVFPAIDLHDGQVVRLRQGKKENIETYDHTPEKAGEKWISNGAEWLHVVNLDGAFGENCSENINAVRHILLKANGTVKVQFGGGLRDLASIDFMLSMGVDRVILGTAAVRDPNLIKAALNTFGPQKIVLGVDARDEQVRIAGWTEQAGVSPSTLIEKFVPYGLNTVIYTNIFRDGTGLGVDVQSTCKIARTTGLKLIASGGVASLEDICTVKTAGLSGVIVGKALYENNFSLTEALQC